jgi:hypothetical protein
LLDLDAFVGSDQVAEDFDVTRGGDEGLVPTAIFIVDVFADNAPVGDVEDLFIV